MKSVRALALLAMLMPVTALAQPGVRDAQGNLLPDTLSTQTVGDFSASMLVTADPNWQQKWETPPEVAPQFEPATEVSVGGDLYILAFVVNPKLDDAGMTNVRCDLRLMRPDGSLSGDERDLPCFITRLETDPRLVYLTSIGVKFTAEAGDEKGTWKAAITVRDMNRNVTLPLQSSFELK
jgi:hypothetical protein